ncbi:transport protein Trs120 or TRAPPC9 TRAPP II complex subunit-domain-containing protein [Obelidium mucronatum]|nr:transport protein Trs120 or TRAPPC9 TRAPP II complex subunit-domain-containing protein [Obelidium mucronatum]
MAILVNSFTTELLRAFTNLVKQIETRVVVTGPTPPSYSATRKVSSVNLTDNQQTGDNIAVVGAAINNSERNKKRTPARALKLVTDLFLMAGRLDIAVQSYQICLEKMKENSDFVWWGATLESFQAAILLTLINRAGIGPLAARQEAGSVKPGDLILRPPTITSILASPVLLTFHPLRAFLAETPDRHREILQIYEYGNATAATNGLSPIPILAVSVCVRVARVLKAMHKFGFAEYLVNGAALNFILSGDANIGDAAKSGSGPNAGNTVSGATPAVSQAGAGVGSAQGVAGDRIIFNNGIGANKLDVNSWLMKANHILGSNVDWIALSDRVWGYANIASIYGSIGFRRKHAFFLREMNLVVSETLRPSGFSGLAASARASRAGRLSSFEDGTRMIDSWKRESLINLEEGEELRFTTEHDSVIGRIDSEKDDGILNLRGGPPNGVIQCYKRVCEVFGLQIRSYKPRVPNTGFLHPTFSDDEEEWLDEFENEDDLKAMDDGKPLATNPTVVVPVSPQAANPIGSAHVRTSSLRNLAAMAVGLSKQHTKSKSSRIRYGWPALQIQVLKECIQVAEAVDDHPYTIYFIIRLLRRLKRHLPPADQHDLADRLEGVILKTLAKSAHDNQPEMLSPISGNFPRPVDRSNEDTRLLPVMVRGVVGGVAGMPLLRKMDVVIQPQRLVPLTHPISWLTGSLDSKTAPKELFLYNPTAEKGKKKKVTLVVNELVYVDLVLANPFAFELDLKSILLRTSGIRFTPKPIATVIPPYTRAHHVRVYGTPLESGTVHFHGCTVKMFGGCLEEELYPLKKALDDPKKKTKDGKRKKQDEKERFGKRPVHAHVVKQDKKPEAVNGPDRSWSVPVEVVPELPLLNVIKGSGIGLGALMIFEGERSSFTLDLENIGTIPINYLRVSFVETITTEVGNSESVEELEKIYERDVYEHNIRAFWLETADGDSNSQGRGASYFARIAPPKALQVIDVVMNPGEKTTVHIGVFGKKMCTGGTIVFEYGSVSYPSQDQSESDENGVFFARQSLVPIILSVQNPLSLHNITVFNINNREASVAVEDREISRAISLEDLVIDHSGVNLRDSVTSEGIKGGRRLNSEHFILSFDLQNLWTLPFEVSFDIYDDSDVSSSPVSTISVNLFPGTTKRIILPIKRIFLPVEQTILPIPLPTWKQFVVGRVEKLSYQEDKFQRLAFWLREALIGLGVGGAPLIDPATGDYMSDLVCGGSAEDGTVGGYGRVVVRWSCGRGRSGRLLRVRDFQLLDQEMVNCVTQEEISITTVAHTCEGVVSDVGDSAAVAAVVARPDLRLLSVVEPESGRIRVKAHEFIALEWKLVNNRYSPITVCLRIQPVFGNIDSISEGDLEEKSVSCDGRMIYSGTLETPLPIVLSGRGGSTTHQVAFMFLSRGVYSLVAHAEEVGRIGDPESVPKKKSKKDKEVDAVALGLVGSAGSLFWGRETTIVLVE